MFGRWFLNSFDSWDRIFDILTSTKPATVWQYNESLIRVYLNKTNKISFKKDLSMVRFLLMTNTRLLARWR